MGVSPMDAFALVGLARMSFASQQPMQLAILTGRTKAGGFLLRGAG